MRCGKEGGGKGALVQDDVSATLSCSNVQTLFQPAAFAANQRGEVRLQGGDGDVFGAIPCSWSAKQVQAVVYREGSFGQYVEGEFGTLKASGGALGGGSETIVAQGGYVVRKLTPRECERLQGFPDDWTRIPWRGRPAEECPDAPRYKAVGNSMAVPVMAWIGRRLEDVDSRACERRGGAIDAGVPEAFEKGTEAACTSR